MFKIMKLMEHTVALRVNGKRISFIILIFAPVTFKSLKKFRIKVKILLKYIIEIKPFIEVKGTKILISIILSMLSPTLTLKVKFCWSSPFNIPSLILSRYISGTKGAKILIIEPTSRFLYIRKPSSSPQKKKTAEKIKPKSAVIVIILSTERRTVPRKPFAIASEISGIRSVERALSSEEGKNKIGSAIPFIMPKKESASEREAPASTRRAGTRELSKMRRREFIYFPLVIGREI